MKSGNGWKGVQKMIRCPKSLVVLSVFLGVSLSSTAAGLENERVVSGFAGEELSSQEIQQEEYYRMVAEDGEALLVTGRRIQLGDEFLTSDNRLFRVYEIEGKTAFAKYLEKKDLEEHLAQNFRREVLAGLFPEGAVSMLKEEGEQAGPKRLIGIYHTHNAESYIPTDGTESIDGKGGIHKVGEAFKEALEEKGIRVIHDETLHLPHDRGAYRRSRVTAQRLLSQGPDVIFDIHRDAAPAEAYETSIDSDVITCVLFVVGLENQNYPVSRSFAFDLKGYSDRLEPELVKGVLMGHGDFNQDLTPLNLLLEIGAHNNTREAAEEGARYFAGVVDYYFYGPPENGSGAAPGGEGGRGGLVARSAGRTIIGLVGFFLVAGFGLLWINAGSSKEFSRIIREWTERTSISAGRIAVSARRYFLSLKEKLEKLLNRRKV